MRVVRSTILLLFVALLAIEPVVHSHPLLPDAHANDGLSTANSCAICAVGTHSITIVTPTAIAPTAVVGFVATTVVLPQSIDSRVSLATRAPPAA